MEESIEFFRQIGFFQQWGRMTNQTIIGKLEKFQEESNLAPFRPSRKTVDFELVAWDSKRVWFQDPDALVLPGNEAYVQAFWELANISRKQFAPTSVEEIWEGNEGPITVRFHHKRKKYEISPKCQETYFDYGIVGNINELLKESRFRFEVCGDILENPIVLLLHEEEKELLRVKRNWTFWEL